MPVKYFDSFPKIEYKMGEDDTTLATDVTRRVGIRKDFTKLISSYYKHVLTTEDRPEVVADIAYDRSDRHWILLHANEVVDPYHDWIKTANELEEYVDARYPNRYIQTDVAFSADCPLSGDIMFGAPQGTWPDGVISTASLTNSPPVAVGKEWADNTYESVSATGGNGTGAVFDIVVSGNTYEFQLVSGGKDYAVGDIITFVDPANVSNDDLKLTIDTVNYYTLTGLNMKTGGTGNFAVDDLVTNGSGVSATVVSWDEDPAYSLLVDRALVVKNITGGSFAVDDTITNGAVSWDIEKIEVRSTDNWRKDSLGTSRIDVLEVETGITGQIFLLSKGWLGVPLSNDEYWPDALITTIITNGDWFTKGNTLRNMSSWESNTPVNERPPDMTISSHVAGKVVSSTSETGVIVYKIITPSTNGATDFIANQYIITKAYSTTEYPTALKVDVIGDEKNAPRYYEVSRANDDGTIDRLQVDYGTISGDNDLSNGYTNNVSAITPTAVTNWEHEIRENEKRREIFAIDLDLIDAFETEFITKMST